MGISQDILYIIGDSAEPQTAEEPVEDMGNPNPFEDEDSSGE